MQQDWQPEAEHGAMYALVGPDYTIDTDAKSVTGSLVAQGVDTGVDVEVRPGGPNVGFQPVPALMYLDDAITLGAVNTDDAIAGAAEQPTVAVASQMTVSPQILMWDPESHPGMTTIREIAATGVPVVTSGDIIPALLASQGIMQPAQSDTSYEGTPARFVSDPTILQQGFATAEPYIYENEIAEWGQPGRLRAARRTTATPSTRSRSPCAPTGSSSCARAWRSWCRSCSSPRSTTSPTRLRPTR